MTSVKFKKLLFDGDILCHKAGAVSEIRHHCVVWPDGESYLAFRYVAQAKEYIKDKPGYSVRMEQEALPLGFAIKCVEGLINTACNELGCGEYEIYLSPTNSNTNFRHQLCSEYKANRKGLKKPINLNGIRKYLVEEHKAQVMVKYEADDALGIMQTHMDSKGETSCIVSIDKDLLQIPGYHYNPDNHELIKASDPGKIWLIQRKSGKKDLKGYGFLFFCAQLLLGDAIDNIFGLKGVGAVKAYNTLSKFNDGKYAFKDMMTEVIKLYRKHDRLQDLQKNSRLLWILRRPSQLTADHLTLLYHTLLPLTPTGDEEEEGCTSAKKDESTDKE